MAGVGIAPKDPSRRARRNVDSIPRSVLTFVPGKQPKLPEKFGIEWHEMTRQWWKMWGVSEQSKLFTITDWNFLLDTAVIHTRFWDGSLSLAQELRVRVAKFGATPEDRARLRMFFADADEKDAKRGTNTPPEGTGSYGDLALV